MIAEPAGGHGGAIQRLPDRCTMTAAIVPIVLGSVVFC